MLKIKNRLLKILVVSFLISLIFTLIDMLLHYSISYLNIIQYTYPQSLLNIINNDLFWYSLFKFLTTFSMIFITLLFIKRINFVKLIIPLLITIVFLQIRYLYYSNYTIYWHILNSTLHLIILMLIAYIILKIFYKQR